MGFPFPSHTRIVLPLTAAQAGDPDHELDLEHGYDDTLPKQIPKQVVLLSPGVVYPGRKGGFGCLSRGVVPQAAKQLVALCLVGLAIWHLYSTLDMSAMHVPITDVTP